MISNSVYSIAIEKASGRLWIGTTGLERFDGTAIWKSWEFFSIPSMIRGLLTGPIVIDANNSKWIASGGLLRIDNAGVWTYFVKDSCGLPDDNITCIVIDKQGSIWLGTSFSGLVKFASATNAVLPPPPQAYQAFTRHGECLMRGTNLIIPLDSRHQAIVSVYAMNGALVLRKMLAPDKATTGSVDVSFLPKGTYAVHIDNGSAALIQKIAIVK
jgi:hypothetical protein